MNLSLVPDLTMRGMPSPYAPPRALTIGRLAGLVSEVAASPDRWWHRVRLDGVPVCLDGGLWLSAWPPGHRAAPDADALIVLAGELTTEPATAVRAGRVHIYGAGHPRELANPGPGYAITLHATIASAVADRRARDARTGDHDRPRLEPMPVHA